MKIFESIHENDLRDLISNVISIDQYKSKIGDDKNVCVVAIKVNNQNPASDLSQFIETGFKDAVDVDISPGPDKDGRYTVFVELNRDSKLFKTIDGLLNDLKQVDHSLENFKFMAYENKTVQDWNEENFRASVISDSYEYVLKHNPNAKAISERIRFLNDY